MKSNKYQHYSFWEHKLDHDENLWYGLFEDKPISRGSLIVSPTLLNSHKGQQEVGYAVYPNAKSVLGFLNFVYLPSAFTGVFERYSPFYIVEEDLYDFFEFQTIMNPDHLHVINKMEAFYDEANALWEVEEDQLIENLIEWTKKFNKNWLKSNKISFSFTIFTSPAHLVRELIEVYEELDEIDVMEKELGFTKEQFIELAGDDLYGNEFMRRKFTDILMNRLDISL